MRERRSFATPFGGKVGGNYRMFSQLNEAPTLSIEVLSKKISFLDSSILFLRPGSPVVIKRAEIPLNYKTSSSDSAVG